MKKVLHILNSLLPSGAETMLKNASEYWTIGEIHIVATTESIGGYAKSLEEAGYIIHHIYDKNEIKQHMKMCKLIKNEKFNIVHVHRESKALLYEFDAYVCGVETIVRTVHNVFKFTGLTRLRRIVTRNLGRWIGVIHVAIGKAVYENEKKILKNECVIVNNWYNNKVYTFVDKDKKSEMRSVLNVSDNTFCIVSVGNCSDVKNHMSILKAIKEISKNTKIMYFHIGKGINEGEEIKYVKEHDLEDVVRFLGYVEPAKYLEASDCYIMPSLHEGVSISALEAMATGMRCILTDVPGLNDFKMYDLDNVKYCELDDDKIRNTLLSVINMGNADNSIKQSNLIYKNYNIKHGVDGYQKLYEKN